MNVQEMNAEFEKIKTRCFSQLAELLSFPSISTSPQHVADCRACATWLCDYLERTGFKSELRETAGQPVVFAERTAQRPAPTILFYGHYDVQPVDPIEEWITPPFEPTWRNKRLYARGAVDNKGQLFYVLQALQLLIENDALPYNVKLLLEGEEECGSKGISQALPLWKADLQADALVVCDTNSMDSGAPTITMGLRGIVDMTMSLTGASHDLHSGVHGGVAPNPAQGIAELVASLHTTSGAVAIEGFYRGVEDPSEETRKLANSEKFDSAQYTSNTGVEPIAGETDFSPIERAGFRPSLDINGISGGYRGKGVKTIIPASASAKITCRLVPGQDPQNILDLLEKHLVVHTPAGLVLNIEEKGIGGRGFRLNTESGLARSAKRILDSISQTPAIFHWEGASIPVVSALAEATGAEPLLVGFGLEEDRAHAPNESFSEEQFRKGFLYAASLFSNPDAIESLHTV